MSNFYRALLSASPYRIRFGASVGCALLVAVLWGGNLATIYPILKVFLRGENLQTSIDHQIVSLRSQMLEQEERSAAFKARMAELADHPSDAAAQQERSSIRLALKSLEKLHIHTKWRLAGCEEVSPFIVRYVPEDRGRTLVLVMLLLMAGLGLNGIFSYFNEFMVGAVTQLSMFDLRNRMFRQSMRLDLSTFAQDGSTELMARFTNDMETLAVGIETLIGKMVREPLKAITCIGFACWLNWRLTAVVLAVVPVAVVLITTIGRTMKRATRRYLESMSSIYGILQEGFQGIKIVKAFTMEPYERRRFFQETKNYFHKVMRIVHLEALVSPLTEMVGVCAITVAVLAGAFLVIGNNDYERTHVLGIRMADLPMDTESLLLLYTLLAGVSDPMRKLSNVYGRIQRAAAAADRIFALLDREPTIADRTQLAPLPRHHGSVEFKEIQFSYPGSPLILKSVSLAVNFGETIALVGPNGCGKTTLLSLIPRFYDPQCGRVLIDGQDIRQTRLRSLRRQIGIVTQETVLFNDTICNNIAYGNRQASRTEIEAAAKKAHAHRFIEELPEGYDTVVGERAVKLSGGQRQRIALARAILRDPAILILDEATSALDVESELLIHRVLEEFVRDRTTFVITHRLSTLQLAHRIVVMNQGRIVDVGIHAELLRGCELYARLHEIHSTARISA